MAGVLGGAEDGDGVGGLGLVFAGDLVDFIDDPAGPEERGEQGEAKQSAEEIPGTGGAASGLRSDGSHCVGGSHSIGGEVGPSIEITLGPLPRLLKDIREPECGRRNLRGGEFTTKA